MELAKLSTRVINLDNVAYATFVGQDVHLYFNFEGHGSHLILTGEDAEEFRLLVDVSLVLG